MYTVDFEEIREEHLAEVLEIYSYHVLNTTATFHTHVLSINEMRESVFFDDPRYRTYVIKLNGAMAGYVMLTQHSKREAYDATAGVTIYLKPDFVGKGIGGQAVQYVEEIAGRQGIHVLVATICGENTASIRLFKRKGFAKCAHYREVGYKFGHYLDVVAYQKILG